MKPLLSDAIKVFVLFAVCTCLFYFGLKVMHAEQEQNRRYDMPEGPAVKVFNEEKTVLDRLNLFFRVGE